MEEIKYIFNAEVIRDFCGGCSINKMQSICIDYLEVLPEAVNMLCSYYHFTIGDNVKDSRSKVYDRLVKELDGVIPVDSSEWNNLDVIRRVYKTTFGITYLNLGERLRYVCESILESDYYKAKHFIDNLEDTEMKKILSKAINGYKTDKINMSYLAPYFKTFG